MNGSADAQSPVTVSLQDLRDGLHHTQFACFSPETNPPNADSVSFKTLEAAFGPSSLGILLVKDLPSEFPSLRHRLLSYATYLANLPESELGT